MKAFPCVRISSGQDFRRPPSGGHFYCFRICCRSGAVGRDLGDRVEKVQEESLSPLHRGRSEVRRRRRGCPAPGPGEGRPCPRPPASPAATGPALPPDSDGGGGGAEDPASGKRSSSGPSPSSPHQTLKPRVRGACSRARSPGRGGRDGGAFVGGSVFDRQCDGRVREGDRRRDQQVQRLGGRIKPGILGNLGSV